MAGTPESPPRHAPLSLRNSRSQKASLAGPSPTADMSQQPSQHPKGVGEAVMYASTECKAEVTRMLQVKYKDTLAAQFMAHKVVQALSSPASKPCSPTGCGVGHGGGIS